MSAEAKNTYTPHFVPLLPAARTPRNRGTMTAPSLTQCHTMPSSEWAGFRVPPCTPPPASLLWFHQARPSTPFCSLERRVPRHAPSASPPPNSTPDAVTLPFTLPASAPVCGTTTHQAAQAGSLGIILALSSHPPLHSAPPCPIPLPSLAPLFS